MPQDDIPPKDQKDEARSVEKHQVNETRKDRPRIKSGLDQNHGIKSAVQDFSSLNLEAKAQAAPISVDKVATVPRAQQPNLVKTDSLVKKNQKPVPCQAEMKGDQDLSMKHEDKDNQEDSILQLESIQQQDSQVQLDQKSGVQDIEADIVLEQESTPQCPQSDLDGHEKPIIQPFQAEVDGEKGLQPVDGIAVSYQTTDMNVECKTSCSSLASELELQVNGKRYFPAIFFGEFATVLNFLVGTFDDSRITSNLRTAKQKQIN